jgi:hypothetical protein
VVEAGRRHPVMAGWLTTVLLAGVVITAAPAGGAPVPVVRGELAHDFHVSYTRMAIEPTVISAQLRLFTDDVTRALIERSRGAAFTLESPAGDAAFRAYLTEMFPVKVNGRLVAPVVVSSAADKDMRSYIVTWTSPTPITSLSMHNAALFELFDDQQNIVKVKHMASGRESTLFYSGGSRADQVVRF